MYPLFLTATNCNLHIEINTYLMLADVEKTIFLYYNSVEKTIF